MSATASESEPSTTTLEISPNYSVCLNSDIRTRAFLRGYKVKPCLNKCSTEHHRRLCRGYHPSRNDQRRNPYWSYYTALECSNHMERIYHPTVFRTTLCAVGAADCPMGEECAYAHSNEEIRCVEAARVSFASLAKSMPPIAPFWRLPLYSFTRAFRRRTMGGRLLFATTDYSYKMSDAGEFVWLRSEPFRLEVTQAAFAEGLTTDVERAGQHLVFKSTVVQGNLQVRLEQLFKSAPAYYETREKQYSSIASGILKTAFDEGGSAVFTSSPEVFVEMDGDVVRVTAVTQGEVQGATLVTSVFEKIDFWVAREGYGTGLTCCSCLEAWSPCQGVSCKNGHFLCSVDGCFTKLAQTQIPSIRSREPWLVCPECEDEYSISNVASHLSQADLKGVLQAVMDRDYQNLFAEFEARVDARVLDVLSTTGETSILAGQVRKEADHIRNNILCLHCPHCNMVYAEFDGCMAILCSSCDEHFCGYCHAKSTDGSAAHEHVCECSMNTKSRGTYHCSTGDIVLVQRRYRRCELKKYLQRFSPSKQVAIVSAIASDLFDLGIDYKVDFNE